MKIVYRSDDGREFETEQECIEYEKRAGKLIEICIEEVDAYDSNGDRIFFSLIDNEDELNEALSDIFYIKFKTQKAINMFDSLVGELDVPNFRGDIAIVEIGKRYFYDSKDDCWKSVESEQYRIDQYAKVFETEI